MLPNPQETAYLVTFTEEILNGKLHLLCSVFLCVFTNKYGDCIFFKKKAEKIVDMDKLHREKDMYMLFVCLCVCV